MSVSKKPFAGTYKGLVITAESLFPGARGKNRGIKAELKTMRREKAEERNSKTLITRKKAVRRTLERLETGLQLNSVQERLIQESKLFV